MIGRGEGGWIWVGDGGERAREGEDLTFDKSDPKDAVIIARLAAGLHRHEPERADAVWARLRHLGARRLQLTGEATGQAETASLSIPRMTVSLIRVR